ncbi:MAG: alpha/beta hydrolase [Actinomycetales bacterium]
MTYTHQPAWRQIQAFLPEPYRLTEATLPTEEWWDHRGHRIHLDTYRNPDAPAKVILFHGVGTNGRQMSTILGHPLAERGYETIAIDMPTYGITQVAPGALVTYDEWVQIGSDLIDVELAKDDRPILLYGLSAGGMETYHVAAMNKKVAGIVGMTFLDQSSLRVRVETGFDPISGLFSSGLTRVLAATPLRSQRVPMRLVSKMRALVNDRDATRACYADKTSAGNKATFAFLSSYLHYKPVVDPADFDVCPVLLTQPAEDKWTPLHLSQPFLASLSKVPVTTVMLEKGGHYPLEQPALDQMVDAIDSFVAERIRN